MYSQNHSIVSVAVSPSELLPDHPVQLVMYPGAAAAEIRRRDATAFLAEAAAFARRRRVFVAPGLYLREKQLCSALLDDQGELVLEQSATHLNPTWAADLTRSDEIRTLETPLGRLALCVDVDIFKPEAARIAALQGAQILISHQALLASDPRRSLTLAGAWQEAQQNCVYVLCANPFEAAILGPCETSADRSGFLTPLSDQYPLLAELSEEKRAAAYQSFPIFKTMNPALYRRHRHELCQ